MIAGIFAPFTRQIPELGSKDPTYGEKPLDTTGKPSRFARRQDDTLPMQEEAFDRADGMNPGRDTAGTPVAA
jgi:hypothetical protein